MIKTRRRSPTENPLPFQLDPEPATETLTSYGGVPLVVQAFRSLGLPEAIKQHVRIKERQRGYDEATFIESFVILNAVGGECLEDFEQLRADQGLAELAGHAMPSPEAARKFLYAFHEDAKIEEAQLRLKEDQKAYIPLSGPEDRDGRSGRHDHREPEAGSESDLRRWARLSADAGSVGGDGLDCVG